MNRREHISTLADFSFPEVEIFLIVITRSKVRFLLYIIVTKIVFYEKSNRHLGNSAYIETEPKLYINCGIWSVWFVW